MKQRTFDIVRKILGISTLSFFICGWLFFNQSTGSAALDMLAAIAAPTSLLIMIISVAALFLDWLGSR
jgi:hypothetical protein